MSQLRYDILIFVKTGFVVLLINNCYKAGRVTRSATGAKLIAFSDIFDAASNSLKEVENLYPGFGVPTDLWTDIKALYDIVSKGTKTSRKLLMLDVVCARKDFRKMKIIRIGFIRSNDNLAMDSQKSASKSGLLSVMATSKLTYNLEQWIVKENVENRVTSVTIWKGRLEKLYMILE